ncbi:GNAT family N-acetyltransferase, partial [Actinomadura rupiterrae]|uniref:GNAT family N-acetyltransferase n=1 Tax=Actinomadura rupiterrae TaxID=559627 RepID=UPI0020A356B6
MDVIALDDPTDPQIRGWHAVLAAVHAAEPDGDPAPQPHQTAARLLGPEQGSRQRLWAAMSGPAMVGVAALRLPGEPGADRPGEIDIRVHPAHRRHGVAARLLAAAADGLRADGRTSVIAQVLARPPAVGFLEAQGFRLVLTLQGLLLRLSDLPPGRVDELLANGPTGYELLRWRGVVPDGFADALAKAKHAMADLAS